MKGRPSINIYRIVHRFRVSLKSIEKWWAMKFKAKFR